MRAALASLLLIAACGAPRPAPDHARAEDPDPPRDPDRDSDPPPAARSPRDLSIDATYADLAAGARRQDDLRDQDADAGCLVRVRDDGYRLEADLAVAVRPLPVPQDDLDDRLARDRAPVRVLTRFGTYGTSSAPTAIGLVAIATALPPTRGTALAIFLTDRGLYARRSDRDEGERDPSRLEWVLDHAAWDEVDLVAVVAEARTPVRAIADLLDRLPASLAGRVTLAVALDEGTRLPDAPAAATDATGAEICTDGLPELPETEPIGDLAPDRIRAGLDPLRRSAEVCVGTSTGPGAAGGRVAIAARIGADGRVSDACVIEDSTGDAILRACLVRAARQLAFDPPTGGAVDFALPLALEPGRAQRQTATCR